jgi:hypothetical protein
VADQRAAAIPGGTTRTCKRGAHELNTSYPLMEKSACGITLVEWCTLQEASIGPVTLHCYFHAQSPV